jgi:hypothetical protein
LSASRRPARAPIGGKGRTPNAVEWFEASASITKETWDFRPTGVVLFVPVSRAGVHKRIKEGKLTAFFFYITSEETTLFGSKRKAKQRPYIAVSVSECKAWAAEMKRKVGYMWMNRMKVHSV